MNRISGVKRFCLPWLFEVSRTAAKAPALTRLRHWTKLSPVLEFHKGYEETEETDHARNCHSECSFGHIRAHCDCRAAVSASGALNCVGPAAPRYKGLC